MNIELVGVPGVGKSYICQSLEAMMLGEKARGENSTLPPTSIRIISPYTSRWINLAKKLARASLFICCHPLTAIRLVSVILGSGQGFKCSRTTKYVNLISEMQSLREAKAQSSLLTDQGVLQGIWSLEMLASSTICERIMQLSQAWLPDVVILIEAERSQHEQQLTCRVNGQSSFDRLRGRKLSQAIELGDDNLNKILAVWSELRPDGRRLEFTNRPGGNVDELYRSLSFQFD